MRVCVWVGGRGGDARPANAGLVHASVSAPTVGLLCLNTPVLLLPACCVAASAQSTLRMCCLAALAAQTTAPAPQLLRCCCRQGTTRTGQSVTLKGRGFKPALPQQTGLISRGSDVPLRASWRTNNRTAGAQADPRLVALGMHTSGLQGCTLLGYKAAHFWACALLSCCRLFIRSPPPSTAAAANGSSLSPARGQAGGDDNAQTPVR